MEQSIRRAALTGASAFLASLCLADDSAAAPTPGSDAELISVGRQLADLYGQRSELDRQAAMSASASVDREVEWLSARCGVLERRAFELRAASLAGLAVKALIAKENNPEWWQATPQELDYDHECSRRLIDDLLALTSSAPAARAARA